MGISRRKFLAGAASVTVLGAGVLVWRSGTLQAVEAVLPEGHVEEAIIPPIDCDLVISNGMIIDGTGSPGYLGAVAIKGEKIVAIGDFVTLDSVEIYDAQGKVICPGFIDIHTHTENYLHAKGNPSMILTQGVTTQIGGNCGTSPKSIEEFWATAGPLGVNLGIFIGYKSLRQRLLGKHSEVKLNQAQIDQMRIMLEKELDAGAVGLSLGLEYYPQFAATKDELIQLAKIVKYKDKVLAAHIRNEFHRVESAFEELADIGRATGVQIQYSHVKALLEENWHRLPKVLQRLSEVHEEGVNITSDVYNYTFSGWDVDYKPVRRSMSTENIYLAMKHDLVFFGSDSGLKSGGKATHPRAYGNFPRLIRSCLDEDIMPLEQAIYKMTGYPAKRFNLNNRGEIQLGRQADLVIFDPTLIKDQATAEQPMIESVGVEAVWLNGQKVIDQGIFSNQYVGQAIRTVRN